MVITSIMARASPRDSLRRKLRRLTEAISEPKRKGLLAPGSSISIGTRRAAIVVASSFGAATCEDRAIAAKLGRLTGVTPSMIPGRDDAAFSTGCVSPKVTFIVWLCVLVAGRLYADRSISLPALV